MTNYKPRHANFMDFNGYIYLLKNNDKVITLDKANASEATYVTCHDFTTDADYQVPVGRKFVIILFVAGYGTHASAKIVTTTAADANTGEVTIMSQAVHNVIPDNTIFQTTITAGLYLTHASTSATGHSTRFQGVETDA